MAEKRMFSKKITDSDAFIEMGAAAQALYFHLNQSADDDGFNNQVQVAMMKAHASVDDLKVLMLKKFIIRFENGVIVIKHWRIHNTLRKDRYMPTAFQDELAQLHIKPNLSYTLDDGCRTVAERLPDGCPSIVEDRLDKDSIDNALDDFQSSDVEAFFNSLWALYPRKEGKGAVSKTKKQKLYRIGFEEMQRTIERYKAKLKAEGTEKQFIKQGSTFFNSGYVDFLDENYETAQSPPAQKPRKGHLVKITNAYGREEEVWRED